jgi:sigma-B regulation protein RsbU (phosphoserine phosphatase)
VGRRPKRHAIVFLLGDGWVREELDFALNTVRAALGSRLTDERVRGSVREAAEIQQSLLLEEPPEFPGFDIACRSIPAEEVGGDFYDFLDFGGQEMLGLAIGDASGHGLPAALLVRDIVTGLRMGIEKDLKVAYVFSKLNRVIHRSNLSSRFVSVFYGELEGDGNIIYVNAGHYPPVLFFKNPTGPLQQVELSTGGTVIGPLPEARFRARRSCFAPTGSSSGATRAASSSAPKAWPRWSARTWPLARRTSSRRSSRPRWRSATGAPSRTMRRSWS